MTIRIKNLTSTGNGGDGVRIGAGSDVEMTDATSERNGGHGLNISAHARFEGQDIRANDNAGSGVHVSKTAISAGLYREIERAVAARTPISEVKNRFGAHLVKYGKAAKIALDVAANGADLLSHFIPGMP